MNSDLYLRYEHQLEVVTMGKWSEEAKRRHSRIMKQRFQDPEYRRKLSERVKATMNDPEFKQKHAEVTKRALANPEVRAKMCKSKTLENNPNWKGGVSIGYKEYTCPICGNVFVGWEIVQPVYCSTTCRDVADALYKVIEYYESRHAAEKS